MQPRELADTRPRTAAESERLVHELQVHQIELEMQNEELRQQQAELDALRKRYFDLYDLAPVGYFTLSEKGVIAEANFTAANLLAVPRSVLVGKPLPRFIFPADQDIYYGLRRLLLETGVPQACELRMRRAGAEPIWVHLDAFALRDALGAPVCRVTLSDITEYRRTEEALRARDAQFRVLQEHSPDGFTILRPVRDARSRVVDFIWVYENAAIARLNGTVPEAVVGRSLLELFPGHAGSPFLRAYQQVAESGATCVFEEKYSGETIATPTWFRIVVVPMGDDIGILAQDITARTWTEADLRASRELMRALASRIQAVREEERTALARDLHDGLAQVLTRLKIDLRLLQTSPAGTRKGSEMKALAARLGTMVGIADAAIQTVQKIATGLRPVILDSMGLCAAVEWQARDFQAHAGIACRTRMPEEELPVGREVATAAFRILQESLTNVLRHANASRVEVVLRQKAGQLILTVKDNGSGMGADALNDPRSIGLTGMRERALLLGGHCEIRSRAGSGTTVDVHLPLEG